VKVTKYATAHDLRRSFGIRWAGKVKPATLQLLMRHHSIETTLRYYVGQNADATADAVWTAYERVSTSVSMAAEGEDGGQQADSQSPCEEKA